MQQRGGAAAEVPLRRCVAQHTAAWWSKCDMSLPYVSMCGAVVLQFCTADARDASTLAQAVAGVDAICCATGTTAFPSNR